MNNEITHRDSLSLSQISHELRNPVTLVSSYLQLFCASHPEVKTFPYWNEIMENMDLLRELLGALSHYNRSEQLQTQRLALDQLALDLLQSMKPVFQKRRIQVHTNFSENLPQIEGDPLKLRQIFFNLLNNAMDAMPQGGSITLTLFQIKSQIHLKVTDTGEGIPPEKSASVFQPFVTTKKNGTDLGLPIVRRITEAHGGTIAFTSTPGTGTCFHLTFPALSAGTEELPAENR